MHNVLIKELKKLFQSYLCDHKLMDKYKLHLERMHGSGHWTDIVHDVDPFEWIELISQVEDEPCWSNLPEGHHYWRNVHNLWLTKCNLMIQMYEEV